MLSNDAAAELLGVRARTVRHLIEGGELLAYHVSRVTKVRPEELETYLQANRV